jgi:hypothetical protein
VSVVLIQFHVRTGYRDLMRDPSVADAMREVLAKVKANAGEGFESDFEERSGRREVPRGAVYTDTYAARRRQARDHVLEQSLDI